MPRYYFHTENGDRIRDDQGEELAGVDAAREEAVTVLGEILRYRGASFWTTRSFSVIVTDAEGQTVVSVTASASDTRAGGLAVIGSRPMSTLHPEPRIANLVDKLSLRDSVSPEEIAVLETILETPYTVPAGADIVREHTRPQHSTLLISGFSARYTTLEDGGRQITEINVAGDFIDLHSLLMKQMDHGVVALTDCVAAQAPHARLIEVTESHPHLTRLLWLDTIIDAAIHRQWLVAMGRRSGLGHLAHLVCELYLRLQAAGQADDLTFELPLTQTMLGDALGLSTVHVSRLISELRNEGVIAWSGGRIQILDWRRLTEIAEFDPTYLRLQSEPV